MPFAAKRRAANSLKTASAGKPPECTSEHAPFDLATVLFPKLFRTREGLSSGGGPIFRPAAVIRADSTERLAAEQKQFKGEPNDGN
jgi:hypothetical protein